MKPFVCSLLALALAAGCDRVPAPAPTSEADARALQTLKDLGVTPEMMLSLVRREVAGQPAVPPVPAAEPPAPADPAAPAEPARPVEPTPPPPPPAETPSLPAVAPAPVVVVITNTIIVQNTPDTPVAPGVPAAANIEVPPPVQSVQEFVQPLSSYGTWVRVAEYGTVWQPYVTVTVAGWRPYCHGGRWMLTERGWYWHSAYSWGWAPFHYGRWCYVPAYRWVWVPDTVWSPAWVCWRQTPECYGWAPMPPRTTFRAGVGFTVTWGDDFDIRFGLTAAAYTFVPRERLVERDVFAVCLTPDRIAPVYRSSSFVRGSFAWDRNHHGVHNIGPSHTMGEFASRHRLRPSPIVTRPTGTPPGNVRPGGPREGREPEPRGGAHRPDTPPAPVVAPTPATPPPPPATPRPSWPDRRDHRTPVSPPAPSVVPVPVPAPAVSPAAPTAPDAVAPGAGERRHGHGADREPEARPRQFLPLAAAVAAPDTGRSYSRSNFLFRNR